MKSNDAPIERVKGWRQKGQGYLLLQHRKSKFRLKREGFVIRDWTTLTTIVSFLKHLKSTDKTLYEVVEKGGSYLDYKERI